jgi:RNA polymerase sigma factor (sigma-70 family)
MNKREQAHWIQSSLARFESQLIRYTYRITRDLEQAREVVQETFLKLWQADRSQVDGHLAEWLYTVCRNGALDLRRKDKRMVPLSNGAEAEAEAQVDSEPTASEKLEAHEVKSQVLEAFGSLPEKQQEVLRLKFQGGLSYAEIARVTGLSVSNVGYIIHTGVQALRARMAPDTVMEGVSHES